MTETLSNSLQRGLSDSPYNLKSRTQNSVTSSTRPQPPLTRELSDTPFYKNRNNEVRRVLREDESSLKRSIEIQKLKDAAKDGYVNRNQNDPPVKQKRPRDARRVVSLDSSAYQKYKESKKKTKKSKRSVSAGEDHSGIMNRLSFENIDVLNTPLSANRSCSEYNRTATPPQSILHVEKTKPKSFWSSMFSWRSSPAKKTKLHNTVHFSDMDDEQSYMVESFRFNQANLTQDELYDFAEYMGNSRQEPNCLSFQFPTSDCNPSISEPSSSSGSFSRRKYNHNKASPGNNPPEKAKRKSSSTYSVLYESSVALDYLFGLSHYTTSYQNEHMVMEIELRNLKEPEMLDVYTVGGTTSRNSFGSSAALNNPTDRESFGLPRILNLDDIMGINNGLSLHTGSMRRVTSLRSLERHSEHGSVGGLHINILGDNRSESGSSRSRTPSIASQRGSSGLVLPPESMFMPLDWKTYGPSLELALRHLATKVRAFYPATRADDFFYESIRIQPFSSGAYLRGMLWAGFCSLFFNCYNFLSWPQLSEAAASGAVGALPLTTYHLVFEKVLYFGLVVQLLLNLLQLPFRMQIHFQCWESSRAVEVDVAINVIRTMLLADSWFLNKALGSCLDTLSVLNLVVTELYLWTSEHNDPLRSLVVSLCATNLLAFVSRIIVATAFSLSMHDPQVLSDARRRGLSKWDLDVLPTFVFANREEVNNDDCSICLGNFDIGEMLISLPCDQKHSFHAVCIRQWLQRQNSCPLCQKLV